MAQDSHGNSDKSKKTILLAEDEEMLRVPLRRIFEREGFSLLVAKDGQEALRAATEHTDGIDLLVSDVRMPGMNGSDLATELKRARPGLRVLLMSAYPQDMNRLDAGWNFFQKPFLRQAILEKVNEILDR